jgi:hypothetical protein
MKSLWDSETSTGQPVATISPSRLVTSSECQVFLPKSCAGSMITRDESTPWATARSASASVRSSTSAMASYSTRYGRVRGGSPPAWLHTSPTPCSAATPGSASSQPPQESLTRSAPAAHSSRAT